MPTFKVHVKWGKEKFSNVECNTDEPPMVFKAQLFALSGVQPDRQKVMVKGTVIKDDDWGSAKLKDGVALLMMGSAEELPQEPGQKTLFVEDMSEHQLASALELPPGLGNLGNTCYMNATLQCLRSMPELRQALKTYKGGISALGGDPDQSITSAIRDLYENMDKTSSAIPPIIMLQVLHMCFPQFSEKSEHGGFQQQDANECWTEIVRCLQKQVPLVMPADFSAEENSIQAQGPAEATAATSAEQFVDRYMGGRFDISMQCIESESETPTHTTETFYQLSCFIEKEVKYMHTGLNSRLEEHIEKHSPSLDRNAKYTKSSKISRLPAYLTIQFVRFYYKEKESVNAKILKDIKFPLNLDMYDMCTEDLQKKLVPMRDRFKEDEDRKVELAQKAKDKGEIVSVTSSGDHKNVKREPYWLSDDQGSNNSGYFELQAVLTHKGRSSSSGHYVSWIRRKGDEWLMFDDDKVSAVTSEDILKLSGGGDWHCAYVLLYGPKILEIDLDAEKQTETVESEAAMEVTPQ